MAATGYDFTNQAWVRKGIYQSCAHPESMNCQCYGKLHAGEPCSLNADQLNGFEED